LLHVFAQTGLGKFQNLWPDGSRLLHRHLHQSSRLAHLRWCCRNARPLRASQHHGMAILLSKHDPAGEHPRHPLRFAIYRTRAEFPDFHTDSSGVPVALLALSVLGALSVPVPVFLLSVLEYSFSTSNRCWLRASSARVPCH
jgi:hypothetical protein